MAILSIAVVSFVCAFAVLFGVIDAQRTCTISGDPHFFYFVDECTDLSDDNSCPSHHYQGGALENGKRWYYIVACQTIVEGSDPPIQVVTGSDRFATSTGLPFAISGEHVECNTERVDGSPTSCIKNIQIDVYDDEPTKIYTVQLGQANTDYEENTWDLDHYYEDVTGTAGQIAFDTSSTFPIVLTVNDASGNVYLTVTITNTGTSSSTFKAVVDWTGEGGSGNAYTVQFTHKKAPTSTITMDENELYKICGLCGNYDQTIDENGNLSPPYLNNGAHIIIEDLDRRLLSRSLLNSGTILYLNNSGMDDAKKMRKTPRIWDLTHLFGDAWAVDEEILTNVSDIFFPSENCIDEITIHCETFYNSDDSGCNNCQFSNTKTDQFIGFENWLQLCIYDTCAAGAYDGLLVETLTYDEILAFGLFDFAADSCGALCDNLGQCPTSCSDSDGNEIECNCSDDSNCISCQTDGHCGQCQSGYFKKSDRNHYCYPCQQYAGEGCMFCQDFNGCGQCSQGYTRVKDDSCGLWYCQ